MWSTAFKSLSSRVEVVVELPAVEPTLRALLSTFQRIDADEATLRYHFAPPRLLRRDGEDMWTPIEDIDLAPIFERDFYLQVRTHAAPGHLLHAAALVRDDRALLLAGASGSGKSTLARALVSRGADYLGDELALVDSAGLVDAVTRPISLPGAPSEAASPNFTVTAYSIRGLGGEEIHSQLWAPRPERLCHQPQPLHLLMCLSEGTSPRAVARQLAPAEAVRELWAHCLRTQASDLERVATLVEQHCCFVLDKGKLESTCEVIEELWRR